MEMISFWRYIVLVQLRLGWLVSYITAFPLVTDSTVVCSVNMITSFLGRWLIHILTKLIFWEARLVKYAVFSLSVPSLVECTRNTLIG
jgi:hypothetical protein